MNTIFILSPGHGYDIKGKRSPEVPPGIVEWEFVREIAIEIYNRARDSGIFRVTDVLFKNGRGYDHSMTLKGRVNVANEIARKYHYPDYRTVYVALHTNAAGNDGWYEAHGTKAFVSQNCSGMSLLAADTIADAIVAEAGTEKRLTTRKNFFELVHTIMPATLIEILFHTSKEDCKIAREKKGEIITAFIKAFTEISKVA